MYIHVVHTELLDLHVRFVIMLMFALLHVLLTGTATTAHPAEAEGSQACTDKGSSCWRKTLINSSVKCPACNKAFVENNVTWFILCWVFLSMFYLHMKLSCRFWNLPNAEGRQKTGTIMQYV